MRRTVPTSFRGRLALVAALALAVRVVYVLSRRDQPVFGDALIYWLDAKEIAAGHGFRHPFTGLPTAEHPPLHILVLALQDLIGVNGYHRQMLLFALIGTGTVVLIAILARRVAGERAGLIAGGVAAIYPNLFMADGTLMSETLYLALLTTVLIVALPLGAPGRDRGGPPPWRRMAAVGVGIALAALTRAEAVALIPLLVLPLSWLAARAWRDRVLLALAGGLAFAVVLAPWTIRNLTTFDEPVLISNNGYAVIVGANCRRTYYGDLVGSWAYSCFTKPVKGDESVVSLGYRKRGTDYAKAHKGRLPVVAAARVGRALEIYRPEQSVFLQATEGRGARTARVGIRFFWVLALLATGGFVLLRRRRRVNWVLLAPIAMAAFTTLAVYGSTRLRIAAEPSLVVLAAISLDALADRLALRRRARSGGPPASAPAG